MKITFKIILVVFIGFQVKLAAQISSKKLPVPDKIFLESVNTSEDAEINYFKKYIGETSKPIIIKRNIIVLIQLLFRGFSYYVST